MSGFSGLQSSQQAEAQSAPWGAILAQQSVRIATLWFVRCLSLAASCVNQDILTAVHITTIKPGASSRQAPPRRIPGTASDRLQRLVRRLIPALQPKWAPLRVTVDTPEAASCVILCEADI